VQRGLKACWTARTMYRRVWAVYRIRNMHLEVFDCRNHGCTGLQILKTNSVRSEESWQMTVAEI
jgi:hypothetical protein